MSGKKRDKDNLTNHAGLALVEAFPTPIDEDDPLRWWTLHATDAIKVDLHEFAKGQQEDPHADKLFAPKWRGPFTGRPDLIAELAPHLRDRVNFLTADSVVSLLGGLRTWWRLFDAIEATPLPGEKHLKRVESVADLTSFHEAAAHQNGMNANNFAALRELANSALHALGLPQLHWLTPDTPEPDRQLISDDMARVLRFALKANWRAVQRDWRLRDQIRREVERQENAVQLIESAQSLHIDRGAWACIPYKDDTVFHLGPSGERLMRNWREFLRISKATGKIVPSGKDLGDGRDTSTFSRLGLTRTEMLAVQFPTLWEVEAAFHMALLDSGWNPSTMLNLDANDPNCVAASLKDPESHLLLRTTETGDDEQEDAENELSMSAPKPRARGKLQFCYGLRKNSCCAPIVVQALIQRNEPLREVLREQLGHAIAEHARLTTTAAVDREKLGRAFKRVQKLRRGVRSAWVYVNRTGKVSWLDKENDGKRFLRPADGKIVTYLAMVVDQLAATGKTIGRVTPSDFRDLFARKFLRDNNGSIIALMLALGHSGLKSTAKYVENNLNRAEHDQVAREFLNHVFDQISASRVDLTILAQLSRHGPLTPEMEGRLLEYRALMRSRLGVGCNDPRNPPASLEPDHAKGHFCGGQRCSLCPNARFLPESLDGFAMRAEELMVISDLIPREAWLRMRFGEELDGIEALLETVFPITEVAAARANWRTRIETGSHRIPGRPLALDQIEESA
jgi:hypothetical protein